MTLIARAGVVGGLLGLAFLAGGAKAPAGMDSPGVALGRIVPQIKFDAVPLEEAIGYVRDIANVNLQVDWKTLELAGIDKRTPVTFHLTNITVERAIRTILREAGNGTALAMDVEDNVVEITTQEAADRILVTEVYDIRDLQFKPLDAGEAPQIQFQLEAVNRGGGAGGGGNNLFSNTGSQVQQAKTADQRGQELADLITAVVRPEVWSVNGGPASIRYYNGTLVVSAPRSVQALIGVPVYK